MTDTTRRDMLKGAAAAAVALPLCLTSKETPAIDKAIELGNLTNPQINDFPDTPSGISKEVEELVRYERRMRSAAKKRKLETGTQGASIPFATMPLNMYCRVSEAQLDTKEPQVPYLHWCFLKGANSLLQHYALEYIHQAKIKPSFIELTQDLTLLGPEQQDNRVRADRVASPRYCVDVEEHYFSMHVTGRMMIDTVTGIVSEIENKVKQAIAVWKSSEQGSRPYNVAVQMEPPQFYCKREAFLLECFGWTRHVGWLTGPDQRIKYANPPRHES